MTSAEPFLAMLSSEKYFEAKPSFFAESGARSKVRLTMTSRDGVFRSDSSALMKTYKERVKIWLSVDDFRSNLFRDKILLEINNF